MKNPDHLDNRVWALDVPLEVVTFDIYRDIHKGIRAELFGVTTAAGSLDARDDAAVTAFGARLGALVALLEGHAEHEDRYLAPLLIRDDEKLADKVTQDHVGLDARLSAIARAFADARATAPAARRLAIHRVYLGLASFSSEYLEHQAVEELEVMPVLATGHTVGELLAVNDQILASIPPEQMAASLSLLLPAMNIDDRTEMLRGLQTGAPPEVFEGVLSIARNVLAPSHARALQQRLGIGAESEGARR